MTAEKSPSLTNFTPALDALLAKYRSPITALIYGRVWRYAQGEKRLCVASTETIAAGLGVDRRTVIRHLKLLTDDGYLKDHTPDVRNRPHVYQTTGKAERENALFGVTESHTDYKEDVTQPSTGVTKSPSGVTQSPTGVTKSPTRCDNLSHEDSIQERKKKEVEERPERHQQPIYTIPKTHPIFQVWNDVVNPPELSKEDVLVLTNTAIEDPPLVKELLEEAYAKYLKKISGKTDKKGNPLNPYRAREILTIYDMDLEPQTVTSHSIMASD